MVNPKKKIKKTRERIKVKRMGMAPYQVHLSALFLRKTSVRAGLNRRKTLISGE